MSKVTNLWLSALALVALTGMGCSAREKAYCDHLITCEGGNDADRTACVDRMVQGSTVFEAYNCGEAWGKYLDCVETSTICKNGKLESNPCDDLEKAASSCRKAASANGGRTIF